MKWIESKLWPVLRRGLAKASSICLATTRLCAQIASFAFQPQVTNKEDCHPSFFFPFSLPLPCITTNITYTITIALTITITLFLFIYLFTLFASIYIYIYIQLIQLRLSFRNLKYETKKDHGKARCDFRLTIILVKDDSLIRFNSVLAPGYIYIYISLLLAGFTLSSVSAIFRQLYKYRFPVL